MMTFINVEEMFMCYEIIIFSLVMISNVFDLLSFIISICGYFYRTSIALYKNSSLINMPYFSALC